MAILPDEKAHSNSNALCSPGAGRTVDIHSMTTMAGNSVRVCGVALVALALASAPAGDAAFAAAKDGSGKTGSSGGHRAGKTHKGQHHHHNGTAVAAGVFVGAPWWPWWDFPAYYPLVAPTAMPVAYIERGEQEAQAADGWLYCPKAQGYF